MCFHQVRFDRGAVVTFSKTPSVEERQATRHKNKSLVDKRTSMTDAVGRFLKDGMSIGLGGFANTRVPVAAVHEIIRQGARELTLFCQSTSFCSELLAGAMILDPENISIRRIELAWYGYEPDTTAPLLRYLAESGRLELVDYTSYDMSARFKAGAMGLPFIPAGVPGPVDLRSDGQGKPVTCPFTGEQVYLLRACHPDLAIVHVQAADMYGNSRIFGARCSCGDLAKAALNTIVTAETILGQDAIRAYPSLTEIHHLAVDAVVDQPFGATPGGCYGYYWYDQEEVNRFRSMSRKFLETGDRRKLQSYYDRLIFDVSNFDQHLELKPYPVLKELCEKDMDQPVIVN